MREKTPFSLAVYLAAVVFSISSVAPGPELVADGGGTRINLEGSRPQKRTARETIDEKIHRQDQEDLAFLKDFVNLGPKQRVAIWEQGKDPSARGAVFLAMDKALVVQGPETAPYLADLVRSGGSYQRVHALKVLCDMDRYVPVEQIDFPGIGGCIRVWQLPSLGTGGCLNQFMIVDGRRIGKAGLEVVRWAAEQQRNKDLRFHARLYSGLLKEDVERLPIDEQVKEWRNAVAKCHGLLGTDMDSLNLSEEIEKVLIEEAPDSIPPLLRVLSQDSNGFVREQAISVLYRVDSLRVRLRTTEIGRETINAIHKAIERGGLKPTFATAEARKELWREIRNQVYDDDRYPGISVPALIALKHFYGVALTRTRSIPIGGEAQEPAPIVKDFITYLTKTDPYYPSWEFTYTEYRFEEVLNPLFRKRVQRYYEAWKEFETHANESR